MGTKDQKYWQILNACILLDMEKGHLKWRMSDLSRRSRVARPTLYYYFGKSKDSILIEACHFFGKVFAGVDEAGMSDYSNRKYAESLYRAKKFLDQVPAIVPFYFVNRDRATEVGELIRHYEKLGVQKRKKFFSKLSDKEAGALFWLQMGISLSPHIQSLADYRMALKLIKIE